MTTIYIYVMIRTFSLQENQANKGVERYRPTILLEQIHISISESFLEIEFQFVIISKPAVLRTI